MSESDRHPPGRVGRGEHRLWLLLLIGLCTWVAWRVGAFDLTNTVTVDGRPVQVPNVYAWVDHPFHATRAHLLLETLKNGEILRWIGNHQGGYPAEFYPLGIPWLDVALWALFLGSLPIIAIHKLAVVAVFLLPAVSYWILVRGDRAHPGIAVLAMAVHVAVPGHWLNGGYTELVGWGLVTNVAGASLALLASAALARFVMQRDHAMGVLALLAAAAGACTNPRSLFAVVVAALAILVVATAVSGRERLKARFVEAVVRVGLVGGIALLLAAPVILALFRYNAEYFFLHYEFYERMTELWSASMTAVSLPVLIVAIVGSIFALLRRPRTIAQAMSATLALYLLFTIWVATSSWVPPLVEQLEAPRLMPFQRQLMIYIGAWAVSALGGALVSRISASKRTYALSATYAVLALGVLVTFVRPISFIPDSYRGLTPVGTVGDADFALFMDAVEEADSLRVDGTSIFVVGNRDDWWHQQLWAPLASDAPFYYDDWMWYWTTTHQGPYDYRNGHYFPNPSEALTRDYFSANGISVVVVTDSSGSSGPSTRQITRSSAVLDHASTVGDWDIYRVAEPTSIVTRGESLPEDIVIGNGRIVASFAEGDGNIVIRRNWFPRWEAFVDGQRVEITHRDDGYMEVPAPPGPARVELRYGITVLDRLGRAAAIAGAAGVLVFAMSGRRLTERFIPEGRIPRA